MASNVKLRRYPNTFLAATLAVPLLLFSTSAHAAVGGSKEPKTSCRIEIDNAHFSTHFEERGLGKYVKVNAKSICNFNQRSVLLTVEIYKMELFRNRLLNVYSTDPTSVKSNGKIIENNGAVVKCKNSRKTKYFGIAYAKAIINGKIQFASRTRSEKITVLRCGT